MGRLEAEEQRPPYGRRDEARMMRMLDSRVSIQNGPSTGESCSLNTNVPITIKV